MVPLIWPHSYALRDAKKTTTKSTTHLIFLLYLHLLYVGEFTLSIAAAFAASFVFFKQQNFVSILRLSRRFFRAIVIYLSVMIKLTTTHRDEQNFDVAVNTFGVTKTRAALRYVPTS